MKKIFLSLLILTVTITASALDVPQLTGRVNDYAAMLTPQAKASIETKLANLEKSDSTQIVVLTIPSLEGDALEDYSIRVAEKWKIGQKKIDNGAILLVVKNDRKIRIEVGRGLEGKLTDLKSRRVISEHIRPKFKAGDFSGGTEAGVDALISIVKGEFQSGDAPAQKGTSSDSSDGIWIYIIFALFAVFILGKASKILGATAGGIGGGAGGLIFGSGLGSIIGFGIGGLILGLIISLIARGIRGGGGGGFYSGGGFGSSDSGSSDSGFSGGGGDFGGGGSSGDW
jgi:uncharacterized protein